MKSGKHVSKKNNRYFVLWLFVFVIALVLALLFFLPVPAQKALTAPEEIQLDVTEESLPTEEPSTPKPEPTPSPEPTLEPMPVGSAPEFERQSGVYTFLLVGLDELSNSTDTMMLVNFDTIHHKIDIVSIPRDTIINVDWWDGRRLNSVYAASLRNHGPGIDYLSMHMKWITGFDVDYYAVMSVDIFVDIIDTIGGIWFDVPQEMRYGDTYAYNDFYIDLDPGYQLLDGYQAMGLCRYRSYFFGDLDRVEMQHAFLKEAVRQFLNIKNIPHAAKAIKIAAEGTNTNLSASNIAWFLGQLLRCREEDISFYTAPGTACTLQGYSYYVLDLYNWLSLLNEHFNPYENPITAGMLNIVYSENGSYYSTRELQGPYYFEPQD